MKTHGIWSHQIYNETVSHVKYGMTLKNATKGFVVINELVSCKGPQESLEKLDN